VKKLISPAQTGNLFFLVLAAAITFVLYSCKEDTVTPPAATSGPISGTVRFVDSNNFVTTGGSYLISAYPKTGWPPTGGPTAYDTLPVVQNQGSYSYTLNGLAFGEYVVSVGFRKDIGGQSPILGIYGCDTSHSFTCLMTPSLFANVQSGSGVSNINFLSWADTSKKIY
jgi:hypothetical protein